MRNKIIIVFLFSLILISFNKVQAYGDIYPGGILNPIQVQIVPDKLDALIQQQNQDRILQQQQQYQQQLLDIQRKQLELQQNQQYNQKFQQESLTNKQACPNKYGVNSVWNGLFIGGGSIICDCKIGYQWNQGKTECVSVPSKIISGGGGGGGSASVAPKTTNLIKKVETTSEYKINSDICKSRDPNSEYYGALNGKGNPACACISGYTRSDKSTDLCIGDTPIVVSESKDLSKIDTTQNIENNVKPKSLWIKIKGWFGF